MELITEDRMQEAWEAMVSEVENAPLLIEEMRKEQPFILAYLLSTGSVLTDKDEQEVLLFYGVAIWRIMRAFDQKLPEISLEQLDTYENKNIRMLEYLEDEPESDFVDTVGMIMGKYHQTALLRFIIGHLMDETKSDLTAQGNRIGMIAIYLKTIIDCLDN